jgi:hemoglobin
MLSDIENRNDIEQLMTSFYEKVKNDITIGFIFTDIVKLNFELHIPIIVNFWETILLDNPVYTKNAMEVHHQLNKKIRLQKINFQAWLTLFYSSVDELFVGQKATLAKTRAKAIADIMLLKMTTENDRMDIKKI